MEKTKRSWPQLFITTVAVIMSLYHLYTCIFGIPESQMHRMLHLMFACVLTFAIYNFKGKKNDGKLGISDIFFIIVTVVSLVYMIANLKVFQNRISFVTPLSTVQIVVFIAVLIMILEATRRLTGPTLPIACIIFILYALFGQYLPGILAHNGFSIQKILEQVVLTSEGVFGSSLGITATYVVVFIIFASFLEVTGAGQFFIDLATSLTGSSRGGPAKVAVVGSCLFGSISGSSVANVVSTGTFTIPLIKSVGYSPTFAGAVEAVASTGGQIMPPVMAAVAFIMADYLGVSYLSICKAALIPAVLYYFCLFFMVDTKAIKLNIKGLPKEKLPNARKVLKEGWYLALPFVVLVGMMFLNYTPMKSGFWALVSLLVIVLIFDRKKLSLENIIKGLKGGATGIISVSATSACAGIIVGVIMLTGLGLKFTSLITLLSGGHLVIAMVIAAVVAIILGMGLPTVQAYIVMSSLVAPALIQMGASPMAAHMFVLYFAVLSCITPPVAIASYAAAAISGADAVKVGFASVKLGIVAYIIPFLFVLNPVLIAQGSLLTVLWTFFTACVGCVALTWGIEGVIDDKLAWYWRLVCLAAAGLLLYPESITDIFGLVLFAVILFVFKFRGRKKSAPEEVAQHEKN